MKKFKYDNKGLTLLEVLIAVGISMLVFTVILSLTTTSLNHYKDIGTDVDVQNEAQLTSNQIRDWLMEVNEGISWKDRDTYSTLTLYYSTNKYEASEENMVGEIKYDKTDQSLRYKVYNYNDVSDPDTVEAYLLSDSIKSFTCDTSKIFTDGYITYTITYEKNEQEWVKANEFTFRNEILVVDSAYEMFGR